MKYPHVMQHDEKDCGAACLSMVSEYYGLKLSITQFRELIGVDIFGSNIYGIEKLPFGYETMLEENGNNLSAGQKQRLAIVRALLKKPDILIMDEATSNLDTITEQNINEIINQVCSEITAIIIAHRLSIIEQKTPSDESVGDECSFFLVMNVFPFLFFDSLLLNVLF